MFTKSQKKTNECSTTTCSINVLFQIYHWSLMIVNDFATDYNSKQNFHNIFSFNN